MTDEVKLFAVIPVEQAQAMLNYFNSIPTTRADLLAGSPVAQFCVMLESAEVIQGVPESTEEPVMLTDSTVVPIREDDDVQTA